MKYSIRGNFNISDGSEIITLLNSFQLWRLITGVSFEIDKANYELKEVFYFEVWLNNPEDKIQLFNLLKPFVDAYGEQIDWHECSHDEQTRTPCVIAEEYRVNINDSN